MKASRAAALQANAITRQAQLLEDNSKLLIALCEKLDIDVNKVLGASEVTEVENAQPEKANDKKAKGKGKKQAEAAEVSDANEVDEAE